MTGIFMASNLWERVRRLEDCDALLGEMIHRMRYLTPTMGALMGSLCGQERFAQLTFLSRCKELLMDGSTMEQAWRTALAEAQKALGREESELLAGLADVLGRTDLESQLDALSGVRELLADRCAGLREQVDKKGGLYRTMGVLCGAAFFILLV
jgi:stage III sporulation protein AB